jgi:hypothetical protein
MTLLANADDDGRYALLVPVSNFVRALLLLAGNAERDYGIRIPAFETPVFPTEAAHAAPALARTAMTLLAHADDDGHYALLVAVSKFVGAVAQRDAFVSELFALDPEVALWEGSRQIARDAGPAFAPVLPSIVPYPLQTARQDVEMVIDSVSHGRSGGTFIPGQNKVLRFNLKPFRDMPWAVESLADYARATGRGFLPWAEDAVKRGIVSAESSAIAQHTSAPAPPSFWPRSAQRSRQIAQANWWAVFSSWQVPKLKSKSS